MASFVITVLILLYVIYVIRKKVSDIKNGTCCSCSSDCSACKSSLKKEA